MSSNSFISFYADAWFASNLWWIIVLAVVLVSILGASAFLLRARLQKKEPIHHKVVVSEYAAALGGLDNVISHTRKGSRIELVLKDYSLLNKDKIKEAGVDGFIIMSNRVTLVIQGDAEAVEKALFPEA